ncbi:SigE family RNA polymerase sigma factor [Amycolatopsis taiwanensis]|uniref:RNA polymerase sigma24 factor n=1 Tax=Amycolatopsis taiwanensis TaxID=342230 RepID=A0A9W6R9L0_9PSEU|nr:SigE family RNA polymerase sigma factor [Amycolatopsis taiwanensis]GLY70770.1 RNA polymerase sigma24 factor [Amycolatopsis taiwanensis]
MGVRDDEFVEFVQRCSMPLRRTAFLVCGDWHRAEDLVQTTLAKVFRAWSRARGMDRREAYARQVLMRTVIDESRRFWHRERPSDALPDRAGPDVNSDLSMDLRRALAALPVRQRATLVLRHWEDLPVHEVARLLRCTEGTVKSQSAKALTALRTMIGTDQLLEGYQ